ncbi:UDP-N-acetylglucosamine 1-carboxyvinyltransferase [Parvularcula sp. ZS-1/3]|uniref:UDP-N-acetylglucosamine 1-carboxyvinyltransferase n=1 Tax=Parvularcula mediterranea TaxID=2732508 RepID=A0A7Y3W5C5_9PROT|nr:UDP-N-acetylglucosamine 1-carboxyvinyltransferase [Parvularcula mediterranea]NNU16640.1 UDP-N-acetylglucosamine 1-carboxyvinyltransferase [Parvularcula mediterranea]
MDKLAIIGGRELYGELRISGAKNSALKVMAACLLTDGKLILDEVPDLADARQLLVLLENHGVQWTREGARLTLDAGTITSTTAPYEIVRKMRASFNVLGPILAREGQAKVSLPGGCAIGARPVDLHLDAFRAMGADIELEEGYVLAEAKGGLKGAEVEFPFVSVGATEHVMMAATLAKGTTVLKNAAREPEIVDLGDCLRAMGAKVEGDGTDTITITGVDRLEGTTHEVVADRIEMGSYAMAVGAVGGELLLERGRRDLLGTAAAVMEESGLTLKEEERGLRVSRWGTPTVSTSVTTEPYPGFATDLQAQYMALMAKGDGEATIKETIFENRFMHVPELRRLGADIDVDGRTATVRGVKRLKGAPVMATDLRASMSLIIAALCAEGQTMISRVYHLDRGFEKLDDKLRSVGALIERIKDED